LKHKRMGQNQGQSPGNKPYFGDCARKPGSLVYSERREFTFEKSVPIGLQ